MTTLIQKKNSNGNSGMIVKRVSVPIGLEELMEGLSKEVILKKPKDIYLFASEYFTKLISLREKSNVYKSHPVRSIQSVTKLKHVNIPPVTKISTARPTKHLSRQLSIRSRSPTVRQTLIQNETATKRNITSKSRDRKSTDRKDSIAKDFSKTALSRDISRASNKKGGTSTGTSSVQSTPRENRQSSVTRKVQSSVIDDPNKAREITKKTHKIKKNNNSEIVKTALIAPIVIDKSGIAANILEPTEVDSIKESEKNQIIHATDSAESTKLSLTTDKVNNTSLHQSVNELVDKDNAAKLELEDQSKTKKSLEDSLDSDILAQSTNVTEVAKIMYPSAEESESLRNQKDDELLTSKEENDSFGGKGEQLNDEKAIADEENTQENINEKAKNTQNGSVSHDDERSLDTATENPKSMNFRQSNLQGNDLELEETDKETLHDRLPETISTKEVLKSDKDRRQKSENEEDLMQSRISEPTAEGLRNDGKLHLENSENILDKINESILEVATKKEDKYLKSDEGNISSEEKVGITDITIQEKDRAENLKEKLNSDHRISRNEADSSDMMHSNLRTDDLIPEKGSDVEDNYNTDNIQSNMESVRKHAEEIIDFIIDKGTEAQNNIVNIDTGHEDATAQKNKENEYQESKMAENVIMPKKRENAIDENADISHHEIIKEGQPTIVTSESQGSDTKVKDHIQECQMDIPGEQTKNSENVQALSVKTVEHQLSQRKNSFEGNKDQLKKSEVKENTIETSGEIQENNGSEANDDSVLNTKDQVIPGEISDSSNTEHIQNNKFTIKMEKSANVNSDDVLTVSILDNFGAENNTKESDNSGNTNKIASNVENIDTTSSTNDTKQERNQFFRKDEELAIKEDDKTKINNESSDSEVIESSQSRSEKVFENIKDAPSSVQPYEMDSPHENVSNIRKKDISPDIKLEIRETEYIKEADSKPHEDDLLNKPYLPNTEKETVIDTFHTEDLNANQNNISSNNEVTKKIINYELSKSQPGLIDSPIKQFIDSFINNEQSNVFKNKDIDGLEKDKPAKSRTNKDEPEEHVDQRKEKTDAESDKNSKGNLSTESVEVYTGNPLIFSSVKDLIDFDTDNAFKSDITKLSESQHQEKSQALGHERSNTETIEHDKNDTESLENYPIKKNDLIENEETQDKYKRSVTEDRGIPEGGIVLVSSREADSEIISKEFDHVNDGNISMEEDAKNTLKFKKSDNVPMDEQTQTKIDNLESHPKSSLPIHEENTTEKNTKGTGSDMCNTTTTKSVEDNIGSEKEENINSIVLGDDEESDDKLKTMNEILGSDHALQSTIVAPNAPEFVDGTDGTVDQIDNDKIISLKLKSENLNEIETTPSEANSSDTVLNLQQPQKEFEQDLSKSNILDTETDSNVGAGSTEIKGSYDQDTKDVLDNNILKIPNSEKSIIMTNNHPNLKEIPGEDTTTKMYTNDEVKENQRNLSLNNTDTPKEDAENMEMNKANQHETGEIASALNTIKNIMDSKMSVQKPGTLDTSVSQYLNSFLGNEQTNVFQNKSIAHNNLEVNIDKSKDQSTIKNHKLMSGKENIINHSTESKIKKSNTNELILMKMERSHSQDNVLSSDGNLPEAATKTTKMRRVRSVGLIKSVENEHKSKIPTSARRSAGRRPLVRQLETDSRDIEDKLSNKKDLNKINEDARRRSNEGDPKVVLRNSKNIKEKTKNASDETETDKIQDKRQEEHKKPLIEKNINKIDIGHDVVTKEDVLIAKTILKGIEGAERHIELIEEKISPNKNKNSEPDYVKSDNENNTELGTEDKGVKSHKDKKEAIHICQQFETMPKEKYESPNETQNETHVKSVPTENIKESSLQNHTDDKALSEEGLLLNTVASEPQQTVNKLVNKKNLPSTVKDIDEEKSHIIDSEKLDLISIKATTETNKSNPSYEIKDKREIKAITEEIQKSEQVNLDKSILENIMTDKLNKTTISNAPEGLEKKIKDNDDGAEDIEQGDAIMQAELKARNLKESNAAVKIQSLWRGHFKRKIMETSNQKSDRLKLKKEDAILKIQAVVRGYLDRLKYKELKEKNTTISIAADTHNRKSEGVKISHDGESDKSLGENNGNLLEKSVADNTNESNLKEPKVISDDNNLIPSIVDNIQNKESEEHLDDNINSAENIDITDKEKMKSDIKEPNGEKQSQASENTNKNTLSNQEEDMNDDNLEILTTQNKDKFVSLMENGDITEISTDKITEKVTDATMEDRNYGEIEKKLNVTANLDQEKGSTDKNEQEVNIRAAESPDILAAANQNKSDVSHDESLDKEIEDKLNGEHLESTFTGMVNQKCSEDPEAKSIDVHPNNDDRQGVENKILEKSLNGPEEKIESNTENQNLSENILDESSAKEEKGIDNNTEQVKNESIDKGNVKYKNTEDKLNNDVKLSHDEINKNFEQDSENRTNDYSNDKAPVITTKLDETTDQEIKKFKPDDNIQEAGGDKPYFYRSDTVVEPNNVKKIVSRLGKDDVINSNIENQLIKDNIELSAKDDNNNTESKDETELESEVRSTVNKILEDNSKHISSLEIEIKAAVKNIMEDNIDNNKHTFAIEKESQNVEKNEGAIMHSQVSSHDIPEHLHMITAVEENGAQLDKTKSNDVGQVVFQDKLEGGISNSIPACEKNESADQSEKNENNLSLLPISDNVRDPCERDLEREKNHIGLKNIEESEAQAILPETNLQPEKPTNDIGQTILFDASKKEKSENYSGTKKNQLTKNENNLILSADQDNESDLIKRDLQNDINQKSLTENRTQAKLSEKNIQLDRTTTIDINQTTMHQTLEKNASENLTPAEKGQSTENKNNLISSTVSDNSSDLNEKQLQSDIGTKNIDENGTQAMLSEANIQPDNTAIDINQTTIHDTLNQGPYQDLPPTEKSTKNENDLILSTALDNKEDLPSDVGPKNIDENRTEAMLTKPDVQSDKTAIDINETTLHDTLIKDTSENLTATEKSTENENNLILSTALDNKEDLPSDVGPKNMDENQTQAMLTKPDVQSDKTTIDINETTLHDTLIKDTSENLTPTEKPTENENNLILSAVPDNARNLNEKDLQNDVGRKNIDENGTQAMLSETNLQPDKTTTDINQGTPYNTLNKGASENITTTEKSIKNENHLILSTVSENASDLNEKDLPSDVGPKNIDENGTLEMLSETIVQPGKTTTGINQTILHDTLIKGTSENLTPTENPTNKENNLILSTVPDNASDLNEKDLMPSNVGPKNIDTNGTQATTSETIIIVQPGKSTTDLDQFSVHDTLNKGTSENITATEKSTKNENNLILSTAPDNAGDLNGKDFKADIGPENIDENGIQAMLLESDVESNKTNGTALHDTSNHVATTEKDQPVDLSTINKNSIIFSPTPDNVNDLSDNELKDDKHQTHSETYVDDVSSVDSVDSVITVVPNVNYDTSSQMNHVSIDHTSTLSNRTSSRDIVQENENKEESKKNLLKKSLSTDALDGHVELLDQVQKTLLDQICGKPVDTASKFDIEQLRKELHDASSLYKEENEDPDFATHHDELLEYLNDFEPEDENTYDSKIIRTPIRELPDIEEEIDASADDTETATRRALESQPGQHMPEFCKTPSTTSVEKFIDSKPLKDHVEILNLEKLKQGHNEIIINDDNIQINRTARDIVAKQINEGSDQKLLHTSELHDSVMIPMDSSSKSALVHSGQLRHTSEFHNTLVVPLPSGSDVNIKNEAKEMLAKDKPPEPTRTESVDTGNQTAFQQSPAGAPNVTSRRGSQDGVDDVEAQASLRDTASTKPKSVESFTHQSQPQSPRFVKQDMESENNNNKRNNAICKKVSTSGKNMEAEAATKIQAGFRGYQVRKQMKSKNVADKSNLERHQLRRKSSGRKITKDTDLAEKSAVKIQAGVRGFLVRRRQKKQINSSASA